MAGLIGLNGAGKTTFLKVLSGLLPTFRSDGICFSGAPVDFRKQDFKLCRYTVFAEDNSFSYFTFREYLAYVCAAYGKSVPDVSELVQGFHFEEYTDTLLRELSTGNRKKKCSFPGSVQTDQACHFMLRQRKRKPRKYPFLFTVPRT